MANNSKNFEDFITIYNELDDFMRKELNQDHKASHSDLIRKMARKNKVFNIYMDELLSFARLRNAIIHNPYNRYAQPIADPHDYVVENIKNTGLRTKAGKSTGYDSGKR